MVLHWWSNCKATVKILSEQQFGAVASPYIASYVFHVADLDKDFGMLKMLMGNLELEIPLSK